MLLGSLLARLMGCLRPAVNSPIEDRIHSQALAPFSDQGSQYAAFIHGQLQAEISRRDSLDQRGARLQQSSALSLGLFSTAVGLVTDSTVPSGHSLVVFLASATALTGAFLCGIAATRLVDYAVADESTLTKMLNERWGDSAVDSRNIVADLEARTIRALRPGNNSKADYLAWGTRIQALGVALGAAAFLLSALGQPTAPSA